MLHTASLSLAYLCDCITPQRLSTILSPGISLNPKMRGIGPFSPNHTRGAQPLRQYVWLRPNNACHCALLQGGARAPPPISQRP